MGAIRLRRKTDTNFTNSHESDWKTYVAKGLLGETFKNIRELPGLTFAWRHDVVGRAGHNAGGVGGIRNGPAAARTIRVVVDAPIVKRTDPGSIIRKHFQGFGVFDAEDFVAGTVVTEAGAQTDLN